MIYGGGKGGVSVFFPPFSRNNDPPPTGLFNNPCVGRDLLHFHVSPKHLFVKLFGPWHTRENKAIIISGQVHRR